MLVRRDNFYQPTDADYTNWIRQAGAIEVVLPHVKDFSCAIDGGAFVGFWTVKLCQRFNRVFAFEPCQENVECLRLNAPDAIVIPYAISNTEKVIGIRKIETVAKRDDLSEVKVFSVPLDSFAFKPGFIKLDLEGHDYSGLVGAEKTIDKYHPVICVETKLDRSGKIAKWLTRKGYKKIYDMRPDEIWI